MFGKNKDEIQEETPEEIPCDKEPILSVIASEESATEGFLNSIAETAASLTPQLSKPEDTFASSTGVLAVFLETDTLSRVLDKVLDIRAKRQDGTPYMIIAVKLNALSAFGTWLHERASSEKLEGIRLIACAEASEIPEQLADKLEPVHESNIIKMPTSPEIDNTEFKYFYTISPSLRKVVKLTRELSLNNVNRIYLLGGPGCGKTSIAYYYWVCRNKGNFVVVNLTAESTSDKTAMKSLLCGHVPGASPGAGAREGALSFARDGVCFLDESHGVTGIVMQVLMEVLDSGQFLPFGATKKRALTCSVIFASNRSWDYLRSLIHPDEHARLGATVIGIKDLKERPEDLIAVLCTTMARFGGQCSSWIPPRGLSGDAWQEILNCPWRGNLRTLIQVLESASIEFCSEDSRGTVLEQKHIAAALSLWEAEDERHEEIYASYS